MDQVSGADCGRGLVVAGAVGKGWQQQQTT